MKTMGFRFGDGDAFGWRHCVSVASCLFFLWVLPTVAQDESFTYTTNADNTITIVSFIGSGESAFIPNLVNGLEVTRIGATAFLYSSSLRYVYMPYGITNIGVLAFAHCPNLLYAPLPNSISRIEYAAFNNCRGLAFAGFSPGFQAPSHLTYIGPWAFENCFNLFTVYIPDGVFAAIGEGAFAGCDRLESAYIGNGITEIPPSMFSYCGNWNDSISFSLGTNIASIGYRAFEGCETMATITIPDSVTVIEPYAFSDCTGLANCTIGAGVTNIGESSFSNCSSLAETYFYGNAPTLGGTGVFAGATNATVYRLAEAMGWPTVPDTWGGRPTALWMRYQLTINGGTGSGSYLYRSLVSIAANPPAVEMTFDRWTGDTQFVESVTSSNTSVTMPARDVTLNATYKDRTYSLTVNGGTGGGAYTNQQRVVIAANPPAIGMTFDRWTGGTQYIQSVTSSNTVVTMPAGNVSLTATYTAVYYTLTVNAGTGGGAFTNQQRVAIAANPPAVGMIFDRWIGDTQYVQSVTSSNTTVIMPAQPITLTATYKDKTYLLTINSGNGGGSFTNQQRVAISANSPAVGMTFDRWTGDTQYVESVVSSNTTVTMPAQPITLTATYTPIHYTLTVNGGTGSGSYTNQQRVTIAANPPAVGMTFDRWTGDTQHVANAMSSNTTVTMPAQNSAIAATYKPLYYTLTVNGGSGSGSYTNQQRVAISANLPPEMAFDRWTGDTAYVDNPRFTNATVTMPAFSISLTATFRSSYLFVTNSPDTNTVTITGYVGPGGEAAIPSVLDGRTVTAIGNYAFSYCNNLTGVIIGAAVTSIGDYAFLGCTNLASILLSTGVTSIGEWAFESCSSLTNIVIPESVTQIGTAAFFRCINLTSVTIPQSLSRIGDSIFFECSQLARFVIPDSITNIGTYAFYRCLALTNMVIPDGVIRIGASAFLGCEGLSDLHIGNGLNHLEPETFRGCTNLTNIWMGNNVTIIGESAFANCYKLTSVNMPASVRTVGDSAFWYCSSLTNLSIGSGVKQIDGYAFSGCGALESLIIPDNVEQLGEWSFSWCSSLSNVFIGRGASNIGEALFLGCSNLTTLAVDSVNSNYCAVADVLFDKGKSLLVQYPGGKAGHYGIPDGVTHLEDWSFAFCENLVSIAIPDSVISIGESAFVGSNLITITIPDSVKNIGIWAFSGCYILTNITVNVANEFYSSIDGVLFNEEVTTLIQCPGGRVGNYIVPDSVTSIGSGSFDGCGNLTSVAIGFGVTNIGKHAFSGCNDLTKVEIPDSVAYLGDYAFAYCGNLLEVTIGNNVAAIGDHTFSGCQALTNIVIPISIAQIGDQAFGDCAFDKIVIPASITNFGRSVFVYCTNLAEVFFMGDAPDYEGDAMFYMTANPTIYYLPGAWGWGSTFAGQPTALWVPGVQDNGSLGVHSGNFGFNVEWAAGLTAVVEGATNLINPIWAPLATNTFTDEAYEFRDPEWTNYPGRYYRIRPEP